MSRTSLVEEVKLLDSNETIINPATEEKQDDIITALNTVGISDTSDTRINPATKEDQVDRRFISGNFLINPVYGADMNVDVGFTGTPDKIHDGIDSVLWTASAISGTWDFSSTTHAKQGVSTVVDYTALEGATVTVEGTNITDTILTEGVDWTAATSNEATATSLASAIDGIAGVSASAAATVITGTADNSVTQADITTFTSDDLVNLPTTGQGVDASVTTNGDEILFKKASTIDMDNFSTLTFNLLLDKWALLKNNEIQIRARLNGVDVGDTVDIGDFVDVAKLGAWQSVVMCKSCFNLTDEIIDELVIETVADEGEPNAPDYYIDIIQWEESGAPVTFTFAPPPGTTFFAEATTILSVVDSTDTEPNVSYNKLAELPRLPNGINTVITIDGQTFISTGLHNNAEILALSRMNLKVFVDGSQKMFHFQQEIPGTILNGDTGDSFGVTINDDMSDMKFFRYYVRGRSEANT